MGISHEYHSTSRRRRGGAGGLARLAGAAAGILLVSFAITVILEHGQKQTEELPTVTANGTAQNILAPLPMQGGADSSADSTAPAADGTAAVTLEQFGPARQTAGAYDSSVIRQPACGQVDLSYFSDAAFLGDSLTVGFSDYSINLGGALICGYTGVGPDAIVNRSAVKSSVRGPEVALDVLAAAQPKKLYILLGTNTLTTVGAADRFLVAEKRNSAVLHFADFISKIRDFPSKNRLQTEMTRCNQFHFSHLFFHFYRCTGSITPAFIPR